MVNLLKARSSDFARNDYIVLLGIRLAESFLVWYEPLCFNREFVKIMWQKDVCHKMTRVRKTSFLRKVSSVRFLSLGFRNLRKVLVCECAVSKGKICVASFIGNKG